MSIGACTKNTQVSLSPEIMIRNTAQSEKKATESFEGEHVRTTKTVSPHTTHTAFFGVTCSGIFSVCLCILIHWIGRSYEAATDCHGLMKSIHRVGCLLQKRLAHLIGRHSGANLTEHSKTIQTVLVFVNLAKREL